MKEAPSNDLSECKAATPIDRVDCPNAPIRTDGWDACKQYGCGAWKNIAGHEHLFIPYCCQTSDCVMCEEVGYIPSKFEAEHIDMYEIIQFSKFVSLSCCTVPGHDGFHLDKFNEESKLRYVRHKDMSNKHPGWKKKNTLKVATRKT